MSSDRKVCADSLRVAGLPSPRTCDICGLGPCQGWDAGDEKSEQTETPIDYMMGDEGNPQSSPERDRMVALLNRVDNSYPVKDAIFHERCALEEMTFAPTAPQAALVEAGRKLVEEACALLEEEAKSLGIRAINFDGTKVGRTAHKDRAECAQQVAALRAFLTHATQHGAELERIDKAAQRIAALFPPNITINDAMYGAIVAVMRDELRGLASNGAELRAKIDALPMFFQNGYPAKETDSHTMIHRAAVLALFDRPETNDAG